MKKRRSLRPDSGSPSASPASSSSPAPSESRIPVFPAPALSDDDALGPSLRAAIAAPTDDAAWDVLEDEAARAQRPEVTADAFLHALSLESLPADVAERIGQRAVRLHDEWFDEPERLVSILDRVLARQPDASWAFERLVMVLTVAARWDELLDAYDRALAHTDDKLRRAQLLDEAAHVAKDFASAGDRSIQYLQALLPLRPSDAQLATSLERLLERQGRHRDLIDLWTARLAVLSRDGKLATRARIAACWLDKLGRADEALAVCEVLLAEDPHDTAGSKLLEKMAVLEATAPEVRRRALELLKGRYAAGKRSADVVRVLEISLDGADPAQRAAIHREIIDRLIELGRVPSALEHAAQLVQLEPRDADARARLRALAEQTGDHQRRADALTSAVEVATDDETRVDLLVEAGRARADLLSDEAKAAEVFARALRLSACEGEVRLDVSRRLEAAYDRLGQGEERLLILESLAELEPELADRRVVLARAASLAASRGEVDRALAAWERRVALDATDLEALDAIVEILQRASRWAALVASLRRRIDASEDPSRRRADLVRIAELTERELADVDGAIATFHTIEETFGATAETVDGLSRLLSIAERFDALAEHLSGAAAREAEPRRRADLLARLGDVHRERLGALEVAAQRYHEALDAEPGHAVARAGLRAILERAELPEVRAAAAATLANAYRTTDDWAALLEIVEHRVQVASDTTARAAVLVESARLHEWRAGDPAAALAAVARAFPLIPADAALEKELVRLAEATAGWPTAVEALGSAIAASASDPLRAGTLRMQQGSLLELNVGDFARALDAYLPVIAAFPESTEASQAVVRVAGRVGRWEHAARAVVDSARAQQRVDGEVAGTFERVAEETAAWDAATAALEETVARAEGLPSVVARDLETCIAMWHRDRRDDGERAERALVRAVAHDASDTEALRMLALLQRSHPDSALLDTLSMLATASDDDLGVLFECAQVALDVVGDRDRALTVLDRLLSAATARWTRSPIALPTLPPTSAPVRPAHFPGSSELRDMSADSFAAWALDKMVVLHVDAGAHARAVDVLERGASMPFDPTAALALRHRAAELASAHVADSGRAIDLYRKILAIVADDARAIGALARLYESAGLLSDLAALRRHELGFAREPDVRVALRLDLARVLGLMDDVDGELSALRENLEERPGDRATIEVAIVVLAAADRHAELANLLSEQALILEGAEEGARAAELWAHVAKFSEVPLGDVPRSLASWGRVVALAPTAEAYDALARLHASRRESSIAIQWLEKRLEATPLGERAETVGRLSSEYLKAGERASALEALRRGLDEEPAARQLREQLATMFRDASAWPALADLLAEGAAHEADPAIRIDWLREGAELQSRQLEDPAAAVPLFEEAAQLAESLPAQPGKDRVRPLKIALADSLRRAGRGEDAQALLSSLVEWYGRRRPPERAQLHVQLAHLARERGDANEALAQLELAASMDMGSAEILRFLGSLAREAGEFARAERAYRALLLIVRRPGVVLDAAIGPSEVLFELHRIAAAQGQEDRARENLESAFEAASASEDEGRRFVQLLRETHNEAFLVRALQARVSAEQNPDTAAATLIELADVLDGLGRVDEALQSRLDALAHVPDSASLHASVRDVARRADKLERYEERLRSLAGRARDGGDSVVAAGFFLRLGELLEQDLGDADRAAVAYAEAEKTGEQTVPATRALARLARARNDRDAELRALRLLVQIDDQDPALRTESIYRLAELDLADDASRDEGVDMLGWAIDRDPQLERALGLIRAVEADDEKVAGLHERIARASGEQSVLLEALERIARLEAPSLELLREGAELAQRVIENERAERLYRRAIELARRDEVVSDVIWALTALADLRRAAEDHAGAIELLLDAANNSPGEWFDLRIAAAELAAGPGQNPRLAAETYEELLTRDAGERRVWEPLLTVLRGLGERDRLERLIARTIDNVFDASERNVLRLERARLLLDVAGREEDAARAFREIVEDEPEQHQAAAALMDLYARTGRDEDLLSLVRSRLEFARDRGDSEQVVALSLRLGSLLEARQREDALDVYRAASELVPEDKSLWQAQVRLLKPNDDPELRAGTMERLLALETGDAAASLALEVASIRQTMSDDDGVVRALDRGFRECPTHEKLRLRLEKALTTREDWGALASVYLTDARNRKDRRAALGRFREAAKLHLDRLGDAVSAANVLAEAHAIAPEDLGVLVELAQARGASGEFGPAVEALDAAFDSAKSDSARVTILRARADVRLRAGEVQAAVADLESAYASGGASVAPDLVAGLESLRATAAYHQNLEIERTTTRRLVEVLSAMGEGIRAHDVLVEWLGRDPNDVDALRTLAAVDGAREDFDGVVDAYARLVRLEEGPAQADVALAMCDAADKVGRQEEAREALEIAIQGNGGDERLRARLRQVYEAIGAYVELGHLTLLDAAHATDPALRFDLLLIAGDLFLRAPGEEGRAIEPLEQAQQLKPFHHEGTLLLADAYTLCGELDRAIELLQPAIERHKNRRSKELAALQHRMARAANAGGGRDIEIQWLTKALECDMQNGQIAAELAEVAIELRQFEVALKALKAVTLMRTPGPMSRALATLRQGQIAYQQGDAKRAIMLAKKALSEEPTLTEAEDFLRELGA